MSRQRNKTRYDRLETDEDINEWSGSSESNPDSVQVVHKKTPLAQFLPEQFYLKERPIPWKAIGYAATLFISGTILLLCGCLIHTGHVDNDKYGDRLWPLIIFGALMFIPGSYHVFIAVQTFRGVRGYSFDEFPSFD